MVLLNGVKYACERCIRGHRVSSCTHTDKPLTMIKPKGRPASQCLHCRELRKIKNVHSSCSCGKKGKSPGQHLASCLCHKNSHCTCPTKDRKDSKLRIKSVDQANLSGIPIKEERAEPPHKLKEEHDILIEDVWIPFEADQGLLDFFQENQVESRPQGDGPYTMQQASTEDDAPRSAASYSLGHLPNPPSDADLDLMENMFPLFPLVGANSFDNSRSLPLLPIPNASLQQYNTDPFGSRDSSSRHSNYQQAQDEGLVSQQTPSRSGASPIVNGSSNGQNSLASSATHNPRPLRASSSFSNGLQHMSAKPKRPESVLSIASSSSNTSKLESSGNLPHGVSKMSSSAAFPPFVNTEVGSCDDLPKNFFDNTNLYNEGHQHSFVSDQEDFTNNIRAFNVGNTPQSSVPSRQALMLRRKVSLSRSHSQLHQNHGLILEDHSLVPLESVDSAEVLKQHANNGVYNVLSNNQEIPERLGEEQWAHSVKATSTNDNIALSTQQTGLL